MSIYRVTTVYQNIFTLKSQSSIPLPGVTTVLPALLAAFVGLLDLLDELRVRRALVAHLVHDDRGVIIRDLRDYGRPLLAKVAHT